MWKKNFIRVVHFISWLILYGISYMTLSLDIGSMKGYIRFMSWERIELIHFINGCGSCSFNRKLESMGIKVLGTVHDLYPHEVKKAPHKMLRHRVSVRRLQAAIWECHNLLTNSKSQYVELQKLFPDKIYFIMNSHP